MEGRRISQGAWLASGLLRPTPPGSPSPRSVGLPVGAQPPPAGTLTSALPCPALPSLSPCPADAGIRQIYLEGTVQPILHRAKMAKPKGLCTQSHKYSKQLRLQKRTVPDPLDSGFPSPRPEEDSTNLSLSRGVLASAGRQMMTCISFGRSWQSQVIYFTRRVSSLP